MSMSNQFLDIHILRNVDVYVKSVSRYSHTEECRFLDG